MNDQEYGLWFWRDTLEQVLPAVLIYAVALAAYWVFVA